MEGETVIRVVCCVCGVEIGRKPGLGTTGTSYTYCATCAPLAMSQLEEAVRGN